MKSEPRKTDLKIKVKPVTKPLAEQETVNFIRKSEPEEKVISDIRETDLKVKIEPIDKETRNSHLKEHIDSRHRNITYTCDHCKYKATLKGNSKRHIKSIHGDTTYSCAQCEYTATYK